MVAVIHALSMNNRRVGRPQSLAAAVAGSSVTVGFYGLANSTNYTLDWGDNSADSSVTSNGSGVVSTTHTYTRAGLFDATLRSGNTLVGTSHPIVGGAVVPSGTITSTQSGTFDFYFRPATTYTVNWGDSSSTDSITTSAAVNERQTLTVTGTPTGGSFIPTINGTATAAVLYNASVSAFQALVDAKPALVGNVVVGGSAGAWTLDFVDDFAETNVSTTSINAAGLTGGTSPNVTVATNTSGVASGKATTTHTYATAGAKTITVTDPANGEVVGTKAVTVV